MLIMSTVWILTPCYNALSCCSTLLIIFKIYWLTTYRGEFIEMSPIRGSSLTFLIKLVILLFFNLRIEERLSLYGLIVQLIISFEKELTEVWKLHGGNRLGINVAFIKRLIWLSLELLINVLRWVLILVLYLLLTWLCNIRIKRIRQLILRAIVILILTSKSFAVL